jgi:hypothetical protein
MGLDSSGSSSIHLLFAYRKGKNGEDALPVEAPRTTYNILNASKKNVEVIIMAKT